MGVHKFEDLRVWQAAKQLSDDVGALTKRDEFRRDPELSHHMNASSLSVMNNISEGFLRRRDKEFLQFLRIAAGSNGELRSCFHAALGRKYLSNEEAESLIEASNVVGRMIRRLQSSLGG